MAIDNIKNILPDLLPGSEYKYANPNKRRAANLLGLAIAIVVQADQNKASKIQRRILFILWINERKKAERYKWRVAEQNYKRDPHTYAKPEARWIESSRQWIQNWLKKSLFGKEVDWYRLHRRIFTELKPSPDYNCKWWRGVKDICEDVTEIVPVAEILRISNDLASTKQKNEQTISQIIAQGEGHTVEFKETLEYSVRDNKHDTNLNKECLKTIAAFLNTDGGTLLIGVRDNGDITGIGRDLPYVQRKNEDGFELKLRDLIKSHFTPFPSGKVDICFEKNEKETICRVDVKPVNKNQTIHLGKDVYIRDGNTTRKLEGRDLTDWFQQRGK